MAQETGPAASQGATEDRYGGFTRFELELEFVQCLANPLYLNHLAAQKLLEDPCLIAYLDYLQYFAQPEYTKFLTYPGPTLKSLQLLQQESFRKEILKPDTVQRLIVESMDATSKWLEAA
ncbi:MAG: Glucan 1,3-beta-glucosidase 3 [Chaenotheca gracillima]|nr:MAG: Glucan 1,3-beta-glucosidase 3 [Chaenotheca gracillima]